MTSSKGRKRLKDHQQLRVMFGYTEEHNARQGTEGTDSDRAMEYTRTLLLLHQRLKN